MIRCTHGASGKEGFEVFSPVKDHAPDPYKSRTAPLIVPASNPKVGTFNAAGTTYTDPAGPPVPYEVNARAFKPDGTTEPNCNPSSLLTDPVDVTAGTAVAASDMTFTDCEAGN